MFASNKLYKLLVRETNNNAEGSTSFWSRETMKKKLLEICHCSQNESIWVVYFMWVQSKCLISRSPCSLVAE